MGRRVFRYAGRDWPDPRNTRAWRRLRDQVVKEEPVCRLGYAGVCTHRSTTADHILPVHQRPDLAMVRGNLRGACAPCNLHRDRSARASRDPRGTRFVPAPALRFFD